MEDLAAVRPKDSVRAGLHWPLKWSFINYMNDLPDGASSVTDGCHVEKGRGFWFEAAASTDDVHQFSGDLRFKGHHGMLYVRLANPRLTVSGDSGTLTVIDSGEDRIELATCDITRTAEAPTHIIGSNVRLTEAGSELFGAVYRAGQALEDFLVIT